MIGRTNALVRALVSSVNGMTGTVVLNANIAYDESETYQAGTIGAALNDRITDEMIDELFQEDPPEMSTNQLSSGMRSMPTLEVPEEDAEETEEVTEEITSETVEETTEPTVEAVNESTEQEDNSR